MSAQELVELIAAELGGPEAKAQAVRVAAALHRAGYLAAVDCSPWRAAGLHSSPPVESALSRRGELPRGSPANRG